MKFEKPIINIAMFEMESVATQASTGVTGQSNLDSAEQAAAASLNGKNDKAVTFEF